MSSADPPRVTQKPASTEAYARRVVWAVGLAFFTSVAASVMVFVALADIAADFEVTLRAVGWVVIAESLIISATMLPFGRVADLVGRRRVHLVGLMIFTVGAVATALSPSFAWLIAARVVMSIGNSLIQSVGTALVAAAFPASQRGRAMGAQTFSVSLGGISGTLLAGQVLRVAGWEMLFWGIVPLLLASLVAGWMVLEPDRPTDAPSDTSRLDWRGSLLSAATVVVLVLTVNNPFDVSWTSWPVTGGVFVGCVLLAWFVRWELGHPSPMLQLRLFKNTVLALAVTARTLVFMVTSATALLLPVYLISLRGVSESWAAPLIVLNSIGLGMAARFAGARSDRVGTMPFMITAVVALIAIALVFSRFDAGTTLWVVGPMTFLAGVAMGSFNVPVNSRILNAVPDSDLGVIGAFTNLARNFGNVGGQAISSAIVASVMARRGFDVPLNEIGDSVGSSEAFVAGWSAAYIALAVVGALALLLLLLPAARRREPLPGAA